MTNRWTKRQSRRRLDRIEAELTDRALSRIEEYLALYKPRGQSAPQTIGRVFGVQ